MFTYYHAERLKFRHTMTEKLGIMMPMFTILLAVFLTREYFAVDSYNWWYLTLLEGMLLMFCGFVGQKDKKMENRSLLVLPIDMKRVWDGKVLVCVRVLVVSNLFLFVVVQLLKWILSSFFQIEFVINNSFTSELCATIILILTFLWQIPLCLFIQQKMGFFVMLLLGLGLHVILGITVALESWFWVIPYAIPGRLMCAVLHILPNGLPAEPGSMTFSPELIETGAILPSIGVSLIWFLIIWKITRRWYGKQGE